MNENTAIAISVVGAFMCIFGCILGCVYYENHSWEVVGKDCIANNMKWERVRINNDLTVDYVCH
jgi:hypothetical protein